MILRLLEATDGEFLYDGEHLRYSHDKMIECGRDADHLPGSYASINPRMSVSEIIAEPIKVCKTIRGREAIERKVYEMMDTVGLARRFVNTYPHELDGGRRQRIGIARALALDPEFIVCDEPVSALDVSIQAQILNLMMDLQEERGLTYMFVTHNLSVVKHISDEIAVMYLGQCVERTTSDELFDRPLHPYTKALLAAIPVPNLSARTRTQSIIRGEVTSPINRAGLPVCARCPEARPACTEGDIR